MKTILKYAIVIAWALLCLTGCVTREYQHDLTDPNGVSHTYYYRSASFASDVYARGVKIATADGTVLEVVMPVQDNDSIKIISPAVGIIQTE